ncbi:MAG: hypothetical protein KGL39_36660 [Patescibacteria group bacterium]|nr:hypothetical protein [Patescibacteria group bacterium]
MKTPEERIYDGDRAAEILKNEVFQAVFDDIEAELYESWKQSPARDAEGRESIHQYLMMLQKVKARLMHTLETGQLAKLEMLHTKTLREKVQDAVGKIW